MAESAIYCFLSAQKPPSFRRCPLKPVVLVGTASRAVRPPPHTHHDRQGRRMWPRAQLLLGHKGPLVPELEARELPRVAGVGSPWLFHPCLPSMWATQILVLRKLTWTQFLSPTARVLTTATVHSHPTPQAQNISCSARRLLPLSNTSCTAVGVGRGPAPGWCPRPHICLGYLLVF